MTLAAGVRPGDVLAGKYRVERVLGEGGMGVVVSAHHLQLDERVAIKFLLPEALKNEDAVARFDREARAAVKIKSEHVARVIDVGRLDSGAPYLVMEHLDGGDLEAWIQQRGPMPVEQAAEFVLQACEAIAEAHALGIVHRDLKPANLFCVQRADGMLSIKVLDFGISKMTGPGVSRPALTSTNTSMGTPFYMSPEQMQSSSRADARSDIWSLGVILFELVTGRVPFEGDGLPGLVLAIVNGAPRALVEVRPDAPPGFQQVVSRCLAKDPAHRFPDVAELALALVEHAPARCRPGVERIQGTLRASSPRLSGAGVIGSAPTHVAAPITSVSWGAPSAAPAYRSILLGAALAVGLALAAVGGALLATRMGSTASAAHGSASASASPPTTTGASPTAEPAPIASSVATPPAPSAPPVPPVIDVPPAPAPASARPPAPSAAAPRVARVPPAAPAVRPGCNPPFTIDAAGTKIFKKECL